MTSAPYRGVANPPPKPLMLFDGDCHFCRRWIERWREMTRGRVDYASSQEAGDKFSEIAPAEFQKAVQFIESDGRVFSGAEAVFRSLGYARGGTWLAWSYNRIPGFAPFTEVAYSLVARNRGAASAGTRLLWGEDVRRPTYFVARRVFLQALGFVYLIAFLSLWLQVDGLVGSDGIAPVREYLSAARAQLGGGGPFLLPTLCWFSSSDAFLNLLCGAGAAFSILLILGLLPGPSLILLYLLYLSLTIAGQAFLSFQWDILLLETGFLAIFFAPWKWRFQRVSDAQVSRISLFLLKLLLFKLMLMSGVVKLTSGDESWWNLTALNYHYETQPLPTILGWWAHQGPEWFRRFSTAFVLGVEIVAPFLIWTPRRLRLLGCGFLVLLQILIALTGNYAFFNLLTLALCLLLVDDTTWRRWLPASRGKGAALESGGRSSVIAYAVLIILLPINACLIFTAFKPEALWPDPIAAVYRNIGPLQIANGYGLFRVMTKTRPEIVIEGSADGIDWLPYTFQWKPGDLKKPPRWVAPHQPRLDWQMWFAALGSPRENRWIFGLMERLLQNSPSVVGLLERNPFPQTPPRYVRAILHGYTFSSIAERRESGDWWKRQEKREYLRPVSLGQP